MTRISASYSKNNGSERNNFLFSIGVIADPQYGDFDDGTNHNKTSCRRYRQSLQISRHAVQAWNDARQTLLMVCLGDVIDRLNSTKLNKCGKTHSASAIKAVLAEFSKFKSSNKKQLWRNIKNKASTYNYAVPVPDFKKADCDRGIPEYPFFHNVVGNHDVYNFNRRQLRKYQYSLPMINNSNGLAMEVEYRYYYSFSPFDGYLFVMLDAFVVSTCGYEYCQNDHPNYVRAEQLLAKHNPNVNKNIPPKDKTDSYNARYAAFNGAFGERQLKWLEHQLRIAQSQQDSVIIFSHLPIAMSRRDHYTGLAWDYARCLQIVNRYSCVKLFLSGHNHPGDEYVDISTGLIHKTIKGAVEADLNTDCFCTIDFFNNNSCEINGYGMVNDQVYKLRQF